MIQATHANLNDETFDGTWPFRARYHEAPGFRMHYVDEGSGPDALGRFHCGGLSIWLRKKSLSRVRSVGVKCTQVGVCGHCASRTPEATLQSVVNELHMPSGENHVECQPKALWRPASHAFSGRCRFP